jgi:hypothetical protein
VQQAQANLAARGRAAACGNRHSTWYSVATELGYSPRCWPIRPRTNPSAASLHPRAFGRHRDYLGAGGSGFTLGDGRLNYAHEEIFEGYYPALWAWTVCTAPTRQQLSPDFQYIQNPGFNQDRGPARFYAVRLHLEY